MNMGERNLVPVLTYLFRRIEKRLDGGPSLIVLDEAWLMLGHPVFRDKIREWLKVLRKANCAVVLATQSISDAERSGIIDVLKESCPTKICLTERRGARAGHAGILRAHRLQRTPDRDRRRRHSEAGILRRHAGRPAPFRHVAGPGGAQLRRCFRQGRPEARIRELLSTYGKDWPTQWLNERGINRYA
jgi:type IV secretion system protein VirB4